MFTVYGLNGRIYSGPLEGLRELAPVQRVARLRAAEPAVTQIEPEPGVILAGPGPDGSSSLATAELLPREALAAYADAQAAAAPRQPLAEVEALMSRRVITVPLSATLTEAQALLVQAGVGQAPVVDGQNRLVGLLLRADLLPGQEDLLTPERWAAWQRQPVAGLMWTPVPSVLPDTPIRQVAQLLVELHLPGLPVLDMRGTMQGFVSRGDLLRALGREPPMEVWT